MKISEILRRTGPSVSFEVFPPKKDKPLEGTKDIVARIAAEHPSFMSVTYGAAGGSTGANTSAIAEHLERACGVPVLAHLTCIAASRDSIRTELANFRAAGVENILCLRGDCPPGMEFPGNPDFRHASDLVRELKGAGFCLGGACYPEGHPESAHFTDDIAHVRERSRSDSTSSPSRCSSTTTSTSTICAFARRGVTVPVVAGIML